MRIAMISAHSSPLAVLGSKESGGMNVYVRELSRELGRRGHEIDIFTRLQNAHTPQIVELDARVRVVHVRAGPPVPYDKNWLLEHLPEFISRIRCFADGEDLAYDLIHSHYWLSGEAALALRRAWGVPFIHMAHTLGALKNRVARSAEERETVRRMRVERRIAQSADALIAATRQDLADLKWHCGADPERIRVVPCGVDLEQFRPLDMAEARRALELPASPHRLVLLVGRIEPLKGIDALIEATALLRTQNGAVGGLTALVAGGHNEEERPLWNAEQRRLDGLRQRLGVTDQVRFLGALSHDRLAQLYAAADIVTMPSHYESFGMAALEGMASGRVVVATSAGGPAYTIEDGVSGLLTPPNNPAALAERLQLLLDDDELRARMSEAARARATRFGWPTVANDVVRVYRETLSVGTHRYAPALVLAEAC